MSINKNCIVYSFDNLEQLDMFYFSIRKLSLSKNNLKNDFLLIVNEEIFQKNKDEILSNVYKINKNINLDIKFISDINKKREGMFYWMFSPFLTEHKKYLFLDNDTIIHGEIKSIFNLKNKFIKGVKTRFKWNEENVKIIKYFLNNSFLINGLYINTGVVLINGDNYRRKILESDLREKLLSFYDNVNNMNFKISDQEFLYINYGNKIKELDKKWNLRLSDRFLLNKHCEIKDDFIFHYNIFIKENDRYKKFNYKFLIDSNVEMKEKEEYLFNCFKKTNFYFPLIGNKNYIKKIVKLFEIENE